MSHRIENHARELATMLDNGQGAQVTQILRNDLYNLSECDFSKLVHATNKYEKDGCGDDLTINAYREKGGPKEHVSVELNRRDKDGLPIVYAETIQSWGNWPEHKPQVIEPNRPIPREGWDPYEAPMQRAGYQNWSSANHYQDRYDRNYRDRYDRNYQDLRYQRPYQEFQPHQTYNRGFRAEDIVLPAVLGIGLGLLFTQGRNNHHHQHFQPRQHFYPQSYNHAPNYFQAYNHHPRRYW